MDILDIDEVLKDDSFILLEDRNQDDVTNILQQWKISNQQNQEVAKNIHLNTRTFTRPKRRAVPLNLENHFHVTQVPTQAQQNNINMQIGGLVTNMQKSFLSDTSPPPSICSLMDGSVDGMNNSLITSADFSNVSFFQTTVDDKMSCNNYEFSADAVTGLRYTLNDVIRDRKALEDLTMSGDNSTLKDFNIAQIDDISLVSKTASGYSTMSSSAESSSGGNNETLQPLNITNTIERNNFTFSASLDKDIEEQIGSDEFIANTTFDLINSIQSQNCDKIINKTTDLKSPSTNVTHDVTFTNKTDIIEKECPNLNETYEYQQLNNSLYGTPENTLIKGANNRYQQSTPFNSMCLRDNISITPSIESVIDEATLSPIIINANKIDVNQSLLDTTYEKLNETNVRNRTFDSTELKQKIQNLEIEDLNDINIESELCLTKTNYVEKNVDVNDDDFDKLLDNIGTFKPTEESIKIQKSVESIKKRYSVAVEKPENSEHTEVTSPNVMSMSRSLNHSAISGTNRLLSLRTRLYDDIDINKSINDLKTSPNEKLPLNLDESIKNNPTDFNEKTDIDQQQQAIVPSENLDNNLKQKIDRRDRDRFKTIRIIKRSNENLSIPCIDDDQNSANAHQMNENVDELTNCNSLKSPPRFSRIDDNSSNINVFNNNKMEVEKPANIYNTYKKPKELYATSAKAQQQNNILQKHQRSLSRPRYISGLHTFRREIPTKAMSADDLDVTQPDLIKTKSNIKQQPLPHEQPILKSPMGAKAKSFHNLSNNFNHVNHSKVPSVGIASKKIISNKSDVNTFKCPNPVSALRPPTAVKRMGLVRPSSGYYSLNTASSNESNDLDNDQQSPVESLSSASSKTSLNAGQQQTKIISVEAETIAARKQIPGIKKPISTGIPKASGLSGLRPPSKLPKSGLPRPSSLVRR